MDKEFIDIYDRCIRVWGIDAQIKMCIEEMSELTKELCKYYREGEMEHLSEETKKHIIEEIADVHNMIDQMEHIFGEAEVDKVRREKLERTNKKLDKIEG